MPDDKQLIDHQFIRRKSCKPLIGTVNEVVRYILNDHTRNDWRIKK
jgi:hypothetical protein